jgi:hypothetical protein
MDLLTNKALAKDAEIQQLSMIISDYLPLLKV